MIKAVRIKNLRSLADTGYIEIKPLTLLLGANSTGKSTFLRSFPLFTQSVNKTLRGPISWFDDSLVDFGDYNTALNKFAKKGETIEFEYVIRMPFAGKYWGPSYKMTDFGLVNEVEELNFSFSLSNDDKGTYINKVTVRIGDLHFKLKISERSSKITFNVNGQEIEAEPNLRWDSRSYNTVLPSFEVQSKDSMRTRSPIEYVFHESIFDFVRKRSDKRLRSFDRVDDIIEGWRYKRPDYLGWLKKKTTITSFKNAISNWKVDSPDFLELYNMIAMEKLLSIWDFFDTELSIFYMGCSYIAPTRAEANRYYRTQGLQTSDIDPYGKNLPEFISSLSAGMAHSYNQYTQNVLGVSVKTKAESGHQSIMVSNDKGEFNITDVGFGYSQILPIVTKLWYASNVNFRNRRYYSMHSMRDEVDSIILMEQPELHLHPAYQAKIADAFINVVKERQDTPRQLRLIAETHSDTILNRIGRRVREGEIAPEDVNVILFEKGFGENNTTVKQTTYNEKGQIKEWPYGFFDPDKD